MFWFELAAATVAKLDNVSSNVNQNMKETISIEHYSISFKERVKYYVLQFIGLVSFAGLISVFRPNSLVAFLSVFSALIAIVFGWKIYQTRYYLVNFYSDGNDVKIMYLNLSVEKMITIPIDRVFAKLIDTSSRSGFSCKLWLCIDDVEFTIEKKFDWQYDEIKEIFMFIKNSRKENLSEKEKIIILSLNDKIQNVPF